MNEVRRVWYASYGSNLSYERFQHYLLGGTPVGAARSNRGARDQTLPKAVVTAWLPLQVSFAGWSTRWGGAVAFASPSSHSSAASRMYELAWSQFEDVFSQENGLTASVVLDYETVTTSDSTDAVDGLYGRVVLLGTHTDGLPILTITTGRELEVAEPSAAYVSTIATGLQSVEGLHESEARRDYLSKLPGMETFPEVSWQEVFKGTWS